MKRSFLNESITNSNNNSYHEPDGPPGLQTMFINSTDTLRKRTIPQGVGSAWNDRPPLFLPPPKQRSFWRSKNSDEVETKTKGGLPEEDPILLKGMIRKGIPQPLRCAVWLSNILAAAHPHQSPEIARSYRTLAKVQVLDHAYDNLWSQGGNATVQLRDNDVTRFSFGNDSIWENIKEMPGVHAMERVLYALHHVLPGMDYAPLLPTLTRILLSYMSESYAFCAIREMAQHSTWYWPCSPSEHTAYCRAFLDVLRKLHPHSAATLEDQAMSERYTTAIFRDMFFEILGEGLVWRIMDIYTLEGIKVLFRFGVALVVLYQKEWKERYIYKLEEDKWWRGLLEFGIEQLNFEVLVKKAYGVHGRGVRKRYRFPRRPILQRIIQLEEEAYLQDKYSREFDGTDIHVVEPLGIAHPKPLSNDDAEPVEAKLAESTLVRTKLAEWLPLSLRFTKLDLLYSTSHHGRTLENFYRHVSSARHTILLLEPWTSHCIVGMYASQTWHPSTRIYGDGSCFLFRIDPNEPEKSGCWKWHPKELLEEELEGQQRYDNKTALLEQFQVGTANYISMGGNPDGSSGLRLNEDLTKAQSNPALGFDNPPLAGDLFDIGLVEVYQMVRQMDDVPVF